MNSVPRPNSRFGRSRVAVAAVVLVALVSSLLTVSGQRRADAQVVTDFTLSVSSAVAATPGDQVDVLVRIAPATSTIAAIAATVTYDPALLSAESCSALVGLGACNQSTAGQVNVQSVDPDGWSTDQDIFRITFVRVSGLEDHALSVAVDSAYNDGGELIAGTAVDGQVGLTPRGDVNCDNLLDIIDALVIAQYTVGNRTETPACPLPNIVGDIYLESGDMNDDQSVDIIDALLIAQCTVGANSECEWAV